MNEIENPGLEPNDVERQYKVTVRCPFCLTLNAIDLTKAGERPLCGDCAKPLLLDRPVKVAGEDFERTVLGSEAPVLVDFYADWCAPCKFVAPLIDELAKTYQGARRSVEAWASNPKR